MIYQQNIQHVVSKTRNENNIARDSNVHNWRHWIWCSFFFTPRVNELLNTREPLGDKSRETLDQAPSQHSHLLPFWQTFSLARLCRVALTHLCLPMLTCAYLCSPVLTCAHPGTPIECWHLQCKKCFSGFDDIFLPSFTTQTQKQFLI